jgi:hypothetical protein
MDSIACARVAPIAKSATGIVDLLSVTRQAAVFEEVRLPHLAQQDQPGKQLEQFSSRAYVRASSVEDERLVDCSFDFRKLRGMQERMLSEIQLRADYFDFATFFHGQPLGKNFS